MEPEGWSETTPERAEIEPWRVLYEQDRSADRVERIAQLNRRAGYRVADSTVVAAGAHVVAERFVAGEHCFVAGGCVVRDDLTMGDHCSLNTGAVTMGKVTLGTGVRVAAYAVLCGFNHVFTDVETPIWLQGLTTEGIVVEDDVWIGTNVSILDGVTVGAHSVIAAGSVVAGDVPPYSVVGGVPARLIRSRLDASPGRQVGRLVRFSETVERQWPEVLRRCEVDDRDAPTYIDRPGADWRPRPQNDAIEIAAAFGEVAPPLSRAEWVDRLQAQQDSRSGVFVDPSEGLGEDPLEHEANGREWPTYGILSTGYALEVLGSGPKDPVWVVEQCDSAQLRARLDALDMGYLAWPSGSWIDAYATGVYLNRKHHASDDDAALLWGWLLARQHPESGMWGRYLPADGSYHFGWLMAVNGFYRLTRGTYAQFGVALPNPEAVIDTVLAHARENRWFAESQRTACNVLDVVHPLWLTAKFTDYRRDEIRNAVAGVLDTVVDDWVDGEGFAFAAGDTPGLQGTEMWLSIAFICADLLGESEGLSWRPRGVHRLEPADSLARGSMSADQLSQ